MSASSAHLAEFLKVVYAERLAKEARLGPLLGESGFSGPAPGASNTPSSNWTPPLGQAQTRSERTPSETRFAELSPSQRPTESATGPFGRPQRLWLTVGGAAVVPILAVAILLWKPAAAAPAKEAIALSQPQPAPVPALVHVVVLDSLPAGSEVYEGARLLGKTPKVWSDAPAGEHQLRLARDGYREENATIVVSQDGQQFSFKLRKLELAKKAPHELGIKAER